MKDADLDEAATRDAYRQTLMYMRRMYQRCKLVHADLSEYNTLCVVPFAGASGTWPYLTSPRVQVLQEKGVLY